MRNILIIQTAFIGDVVLATPLVESLATSFPEAKIDFILRKGNENLLEANPHINKLYIWNKKADKYKELLKILKEIRKVKYNYVINLQRFASTGFLTAFSGGEKKIGFKKNPFSFAFTVKKEHRFETGVHEVDRNLDLIRDFATDIVKQPKLHPSQSDYNVIKPHENKSYICLAPASVWHTKQLPEKQWVKLCKLLSDFHVCFLGAPSDKLMCERIIAESGINSFTNYCGTLTFLQSAALMEKATMTYVNDSAPLHFASSVNAKTTAFFCSTIPQFGFGPLSDSSTIAEIDYKLDCRPCGLHGKKECPKGHFDCGNKIDVSKYLPVND